MSQILVLFNCKCVTLYMFSHLSPSYSSLLDDPDEFVNVCTQQAEQSMADSNLLDSRISLAKQMSTSIRARVGKLAQQQKSGEIPPSALISTPFVRFPPHDAQHETMLNRLLQLTDEQWDLLRTSSNQMPFPVASFMIGNETLRQPRKFAA